MDTKRILGECRKLGAKKVLVQIPDGLKTKVQELSDSLEDGGLKTVIHCEPCYGACDIPSHDARLMGCDAIIHIGHTDWGLKTEIPVIYEEYRMKADPVPILERHMNVLAPAKKIGLFTTLQYLDALEPARKFLENNGKEVKTGTSRHCRYPGQVVGCDFSGAREIESLVDAYLFIGTGLFHPIGLAMAVEKPVLFLSLENGNLINMKDEKEMLVRIRFAQIEKAKDMKNFGILVSTKQGQMHIKTAEKVKKELESKGKSAWILSMNNITPEKIMGMKLDVLVNCACPRLTGDFRHFRKPILDPDDINKL